MAPNLDPRDLAAQYGLDYNEIQSIPELAQLFKQAVANTYSAERFTALLKNTNWWKTTSDTERQFIDMQTSDPATFAQKFSDAAFKANALAVQLGLPSMIEGGTNYNAMNWTLRDAAFLIMAKGYSDDRVKSWLGGQLNLQAGVPLGGQAAQVYNQLHQLSYLNGRQHSEEWFDWQTKSVVSGRSTIEQAESQIRQEAAAEYKGFSQQILAGQDAMTLAAPYLHSVSTLLEKPEGSIGLNDPLMRKAMTTVGKDGGAYSIWQLENDVRNDDRWRGTQNAQDSAMKLARDVLSNFGFAY